MKDELKQRNSRIKKCKSFYWLIQNKKKKTLNPLKINSKVEEDLEHARKRMAKKKDAIHFVKEKIEKCKIMVKSSENATNNKINNDKDGFNILKVRLIEYEKQRIDELNRFVFDLIEIKQK